VSKYAGHLRLSHLSRHLALFELYKKTFYLPGSMAEFGLYQGSTYFLLARLIEMFHASEHEVHHSASRHLYGFESFTGFSEILPEDTAGAAGGPKKVGGLKGDRMAFFDTLEGFKTDCRVAARLHVIEGDILQTFSRFVQENYWRAVCSRSRRFRPLRHDKGGLGPPARLDGARRHHHLR
jgi:hypothetical protein